MDSLSSPPIMNKNVAVNKQHFEGVAQMLRIDAQPRRLCNDDAHCQFDTIKRKGHSCRLYAAVWLSQRVFGAGLSVSEHSKKHVLWCLMFNVVIRTKRKCPDIL